MPPESVDNDDLKRLLEENIEVTKENNRLLREMRRNAILGIIARVVIWLIVLGVPLFFLSAYLGPILDAFSGQAGASGLEVGLFGLPSEEQIRQLFEQYQAAGQ